MMSTSLPNQDSGQSDSGSETQTESSLVTSYVVRITPHDKFTQEELKEFLQMEPLLCRYVVGVESTPRVHYHLVCTVDIEVEIQQVRDIIRAFVCPFWYDDRMKLPKGFGNKQYNLQVCEDVDKAISYAIKEREYWFEGYDQDYIDLRLSESFDKKSPKNFKVEYQLLCDEFQITPTLSIRDFMVRFIGLKAKYGQQVKLNDAQGYAYSALVRRDPDQALLLVDKFLRN